MKKFPLLKTKIEIPEITLNLISKTINGPTRSLRVNTHGMAELSHEYGIDIEAEFITSLTEQIYIEIERELSNLNNNER